VSLVGEAGIRWSDDACYRMGASLAFYAIFSIFPLLLVAVAILGFFLGNDAANRERLIDLVAGALSDPSRELLDDTLRGMQTHQTARGVGALIGAATLVFGASGVFSELKTSLNVIWRVKDGPSPHFGFGASLLRAAEDKVIAFASVAAAGAVLLTSLFVSTALASLGGDTGPLASHALAWDVADALASLGLSAVVFAIVFRTLPRAAVAWRDVGAGAFVTSLIFGALKHLFAWYLGHLGSYAAYGAAGAFLGLLMWIYLVSLVVLLGAELTRVYAEREGSLSPRASLTRGPSQGNESDKARLRLGRERAADGGDPTNGTPSSSGGA
jgi:membrane protein